MKRPNFFPHTGPRVDAIYVNEDMTVDRFAVLAWAELPEDRQRNGVDFTAMTWNPEGYMEFVNGDGLEDRFLTLWDGDTPLPDVDDDRCVGLATRRELALRQTLKNGLGGILGRATDPDDAVDRFFAVVLRFYLKHGITLDPDVIVSEVEHQITGHLAPHVQSRVIRFGQGDDEAAQKWKAHGSAAMDLLRSAQEVCLAEYGLKVGLREAIREADNRRGDLEEVA